MAGELMVEEYKSLRKELLQLAASVSRWQLVGFVVAGIGVGMAIALHDFWEAIAVGTLIIIAGCIFGIIHDLTSILRIAAYIQAFHEGQDTGALWETRLEGIRGAKVFVPLRNYMTPIPSLLWVGFICAIVPIAHHFITSSWHQANPESQLVIVIPFVWLVFWLIMQTSYRAFGSGGFKQQTLHAFYESLRKPKKDE